MLELQGIMGWINGIMIGIGVGLAAIFALWGTIQITTSGSDQRKHEAGVTTLRNVGIGVVAMALVIPALNIAATRLGLATVAEPEMNMAPTAEIAVITVGAPSATAGITVNYTKPIRVANAGDLKLAIHNLTTNTFAELDVTAPAANTTPQTLTFPGGTNYATGNNVRLLGYRYGAATIVDASTGDTAVSSFPAQQYTAP